jgi:archaemetzincin
LIDDLRLSLDINYVIAKPYALPKTLLNRETGQLRVDLALSDVAQRYRRSGYFRVLGVTAKDITIPNYNFLFGLAETGDFACMMSVHRLSWGADEKLTRERIAKIALHEIGHTLGRGHTPDTDSVMVYADSLSGLDESGSRFTELDATIILTKIPELAGKIRVANPSDPEE